MPVIVVGADTSLGEAITHALVGEGGEVRAFVTSLDAAERLKERGVKVAIGDVSDASHIAGAAYQTFCAVLIAEAATDGRERAFAPDRTGVIAAWVEALEEAAPTRAIWVTDEAPGEKALAATSESAVVDASAPDDVIVHRVADLEGAERLTGR